MSDHFVLWNNSVWKVRIPESLVWTNEVPLYMKQANLSMWLLPQEWWESNYGILFVEWCMGKNPQLLFNWKTKSTAVCFLWYSSYGFFWFFLQFFFFSFFVYRCVCVWWRKEMFYLTTHSTHFIYGYMASEIW